MTKYIVYFKQPCVSRTAIWLEAPNEDQAKQQAWSRIFTDSLDWDYYFDDPIELDDIVEDDGN